MGGTPGCSISRDQDVDVDNGGRLSSKCCGCSQWGGWLGTSCSFSPTVNFLRALAGGWGDAGKFLCFPMWPPRFLNSAVLFCFLLLLCCLELFPSYVLHFVTVCLLLLFCFGGDECWDLLTLHFANIIHKALHPVTEANEVLGDEEL